MSLLSRVLRNNWECEITDKRFHLYSRKIAMANVEIIDCPKPATDNFIEAYVSQAMYMCPFRVY